MKTIMNIVKMDFAICKRSLIIMSISMIVAGIACLFFMPPILLGLFIVGATAVISAIFSVENKSNMQFFYGCLPIEKKYYVFGRSLSSLLILAIPSIICFAFNWIGEHYSLCIVEEIQTIIDWMGEKQLPMICFMVMIGLLGSGNLLLVSFGGKIESREIMEVLLLLLEALVGGAIIWIIKEIFYNGSNMEFMNAIQDILENHIGFACTMIIALGIIFLAICSLISVKLLKRKNA